MKLLRSILKYFLMWRWKRMNEPIAFETLDGTLSNEIYINQILTVIIEVGIIIVVYTNGAHDRFPATDKNLSLAYKILKALRNMPRP